MKSNDNVTPYTADEYNRNIVKTIPGYREFHQETIDLVKTVALEAAVWLDTGCGTGNLVDLAFPHFPRTVFLLADPSEKMLTQAKKRLRRIPAVRIRFLDPVGTEQIVNPLPQAPVVISAILCHHYFRPEQRRKAVQHCFNLLAQGGIYITFENIRPVSERGIAIGMERWKRFQLSQGRSMEVVEEHLKRFDQDYFPITIQEHLALLRETGFSVVELLRHSYMQAGFYAIK